LTKEHTLQYKSSLWANSDRQTISTCSVYDEVQVEVFVENPTRKQTITSLVRVAIYRDKALSFDEIAKKESRLLTLYPFSTGKISISFSPKRESGYHYVVFIEGKETFTQPKRFPPRLYASKKETTLILNKPLSNVLTGSRFTLTGKLVSADTGESIEAAKIRIYDVRHMRPDKVIDSGTTASDGIFSTERIAKKMHWWNNTAEVYAKFEGDDVYKPSKSNQYAVNFTHNLSHKYLLAET